MDVEGLARGEGLGVGRMISSHRGRVPFLVGGVPADR